MGDGPGGMGINGIRFFLTGGGTTDIAEAVGDGKLAGGDMFMVPSVVGFPAS